MEAQMEKVKSLVLIGTKLFVFSFLWTCVLVGAHQVEAKKVTALRIGKGEAKVNFLAGSVQVIPEGEKQWHPLKVKDALRGGDEVSTGPNARLELVLPDNSYVRFADHTHFKISQVNYAEESKPKNVRIHVVIGRTWANVSGAFRENSSFAMSCENAVAGVRGTIYRMNVNEDKSALVRVYDGTVSVTGGGKTIEPPEKIGPPEKIAGPKRIPGPTKVSMEEWTFIIKAMQQIVIRGDGTPEKTRDFTEAEDRDEWVDWNRLRDSQIRQQ